MAGQTAKVNYEVRRGDTTSFDHRLTIGADLQSSAPIDLTGWELKGQVKYDIDEPATWVDLPIVIYDAADGRFRIYFNATESSTLIAIGSPDSTIGAYDIQLREIGNEDATTQTIMSGTFSVIQDVTRILP